LGWKKPGRTWKKLPRRSSSLQLIPTKEMHLCKSHPTAELGFLSDETTGIVSSTGRSILQTPRLLGCSTLGQSHRESTFFLLSNVIPMSGWLIPQGIQVSTTAVTQHQTASFFKDIVQRVG
jgi:hypothetical protein